MKNVNTRTEIFDDELALVAGGNYGDGSRDTGDIPRYQPGETVEVYDSCLHISTHTDKIIRIVKRKPSIFLKERWFYIMENGDSVSADHIQG